VQADNQLDDNTCRSIDTVISRESNVTRSARVMQVESFFDMRGSEHSRVQIGVKMPLAEREWGVGLIVGPSGCGKTTIARELFSENYVKSYDWSENRSILDDFDKSLGIKDIISALTSVGFSTQPNWVRPYSVLSSGEQFRVTCARAMSEKRGFVVIDEFTSVVDRQVAKVISHVLQKKVRREKTRLIAVTCHYDVIDWLQPDWIYEPHANSFAWRQPEPHPPFDLRYMLARGLRGACLRVITI